MKSRLLKRFLQGAAAIGAAAVVAACGMPPTSGPTGVLNGQRVGGGPLLDCRGYFSQATRDIKFNVGMLQGPGVGFGFASTPLLALDSITGDMIVHYQRYCHQYNVGLISREELLRKSDMLYATQTVIRALVANQRQLPSPGPNHGLQATGTGGLSAESASAGAGSDADPAVALERMKLAGSIFKAILESMGPAESSSDVAVQSRNPASPLTPASSSQVVAQTLVSTGPDAGAEPVFRSLVSELAQIARTQGPATPPIKVALGDVHYRNTEFASALSLFIKNGLRREISRSASFVLVERPRLRGVGGITPGYYQGPPAPGRVGDLTIQGNYWDLSDGVELLLSMRQRKGTVLGVSRAHFPLGALPRGVAVAPANLKEAQLNELMEDRMAPLSAAQTTSPLKVEVWTDRGTGSVYRQGEEVRVMARVNRGAYLRLYYTDAGNRVVQIFPNQYRTDGWIRGGQVVTIPSPDDRFAFQVKPPFGVEAITALASLVPFNAPEVNAVPAGPFFRVSSGVRGLAVVSASPGKGETVRSRAVLTTVAANQDSGR